MMNFLGALAVAGIAAWAAMVGILYLMQDDYVYAGRGGAPAAMAAGWSRVEIASPDGPFAVYHRPAAPGMPTVVFLHGNATTYEGSVVATRGFWERGAGVLVPEYPGYAGNPGRPREAAIDAAADRAYDWLAGHGVTGRDIIVYGNSIGSGPAVHLAQRDHAVLLLVSPVSSLTDLVRERMPWVPTLLVHDAWRNAENARHVRGPVLVAHARDDQVVPFAQGERMARATRGRLIALPSGGHAIAFDPETSRNLAAQTLDDWREASEGATAQRSDPQGRERELDRGGAAR